MRFEVKEGHLEKVLTLLRRTGGYIAPCFELDVNDIFQSDKYPYFIHQCEFHETTDPRLIRKLVGRLRRSKWIRNLEYDEKPDPAFYLRQWFSESTKEEQKREKTYQFRLREKLEDE